VAQRVEQGLIDPVRLSPPYRRYRPDQLFDHLVTGRPPEPAAGPDHVLVHGNPTLANTLMEGGRVSGYTGWARAGVGDRYLDLAVIARDLAARVSPHALGPFVDAYGIEAPDVRRLDFFVLLTELL
jgi:aminoglycoside phosphotransferase